MFERLSYHFFKRRLRKKMASLYEVEDPWSSGYLSEVFEPFLRARMAALPEEIRRAPVLDAGGGEGHYYPRLQDLISEYHLLDLNKTALSRAAVKTGNVKTRLIHLSLDEFRPEPAFYGCIWLISVLNYLGGARYSGRVFAILTRLWQSLKPGGLMILIHPYYSPAELEQLRAFSRFLVEKGGMDTHRECRNIGRQSFLLEALQLRK